MKSPTEMQLLVACCLRCSQSVFCLFASKWGYFCPAHTVGISVHQRWEQSNSLEKSGIIWLMFIERRLVSFALQKGKTQAFHGHLADYKRSMIQILEVSTFCQWRASDLDGNRGRDRRAPRSQTICFRASNRLASFYILKTRSCVGFRPTKGTEGIKTWIYGSRWNHDILWSASDNTGNITTHRMLQFITVDEWCKQMETNLH